MAKPRSETYMATNGIYEAEVYRAAPYKLFQKFCDEIFGEGAVVVKEAAGNSITGRFKFVDACADFKENLRQRLIRLRDKFANSIYYQVLLSQVGLLADPVQWERANAKLAAYDILWNDYVFDPMRLRRIGLVAHTYAKETGVKEKKTENFGYLSDADKEFYFNAEMFGDSADEVDEPYDPYRHAEKTKDLLFKRCINNILKKGMYVQVLVRVPWYDDLLTSFKNINETYYRALARRTFCGYLNDPTPMKDIIPSFKGKETVDEVSRHLAGIIVIEDDLNKGSHTCHAFVNPNGAEVHGLATDYLRELVNSEAEKGVFDDFRYDNY